MRDQKLTRIAALVGMFALGLLAAPLFAKESPAAVKPVDINSATQSELEAVKGIGPATAKKIIAGRPYKSLDDLTKAGLSPKTVDKLKPMLTVGSGAAAAPPAAAAAAPKAEAKKPVESAASSPTSVQAPPAKGMVWVNTATKVFHREGDPWYGKTKHGKYMTEEDAVKAGYHESKEKPKK